MIAKGNPDQWDPSYPGRGLLVKNIADGQAYVLEEKGKVHGTFAFIVGEEPTYTKRRFVTDSGVRMKRTERFIA